MRGVGPGTVLGGRYTVRRRLEQLHGTERWSADDTTLGRTVSMLCIPGDDHRTPALLDAARRAASVTHVVFVRILDVGGDEDVAYVVEEDLGEARTLAELVTDGGVPGDEVRRITGEVAAALESAGQRGMHHLDLKPDDVLRTPDGDVRLRGLETAAVRAGEDGTESEDAARRDAVGVVALTYAGLTGLWPLGAGGSGLAGAPGCPVASLRPPRSPRVFRATSTPSAASPSTTTRAPPAPATSPARSRRGPPARSWAARSPAPRSPATTTTPRPRMPGGRAARDGAAVPVPPAPAPPWPTPPTSPSPSSSPSCPRLPPPPSSSRPPGPRRPMSRPGHRRRKRPLGRKAAAALGLAGGAAAVAGTSTASGAGASGRGRRQCAPVDEADEATRTIPVVEEEPDWLNATTVVSPVGDSHRPPARPASTGSTTTTTARRPVRPLPVPRSPAPSARSARRWATWPSGPSTRSPSSAPTPRPAPMTASRRRRPSCRPSRSPRTSRSWPWASSSPSSCWRWSSASTASRRSGPGATRSSATPPPRRPARPRSHRRRPPPPAATRRRPASSTAEPLAILKVEAYDPEGDGEENNNLTPKIYDGDKGTGWFSENYRTDSFGGLKKGLGVIVDLGPNKKPQSVELNIPHPADIEVYVGPDNRLEGATKIGEKADADGNVTFDVPADVSGQYIVVWFTKLSPDDNDKRRAWLDEVVVTG